MIETQTVFDIAIVAYALIGIGYFYDQAHGSPNGFIITRTWKSFWDTAVVAPLVLLLIGIAAILIETYYLARRIWRNFK